jgi:hypothetical protein
MSYLFALLDQAAWLPLVAACLIVGAATADTWRVVADQWRSTR